MTFDAEVVKVEDVGVEAAVTCVLFRTSAGVIERCGDVTFRMSIRKAAKWPLGRRVRVSIEAAR